MQRRRFFSVCALALGLGCSRTEHSQSAPAKPSAAPVASDSARGPSLEPERPAALSAITGSALIQQIKGSGQRGVIVNVWAIWCQPCREELPMLARVGPTLAAQGVPVWLVSLDDPGAFVVANALLDSLHSPLRRFGAAPPLETFKSELNPKWPDVIPLSFLFDATGQLRYVWTGEVHERELLPIVAAFLAGKALDSVSAP